MTQTEVLNLIKTGNRLSSTDYGHFIRKLID